jgi:hypothetical protein
MISCPPRHAAVLAARQLRSLLRVIPLVDDGRELNPDAVEPGGTDCRKAVGYLSISDFARTAPRLELVARLLRSLLTRFRPLKEGCPLRPDGFRLRKLSDWAMPHGGGAAPMLELLSSPCRVSCSFCYHLGNPPGVGGTRQDVTWDEIVTRLRYFRTGRQLPSRNLSDVDEVFTHPRCFDVLDALFADGPRVVVANTNGSTLTESVVARLAGYQWVLVNLSLTSSDPVVRRSQMHDTRPGVAIGSLDRLDRHKVPYSVSIVAWPPIGLDDLERTIRFCDSHLPAHIRVYFPGATRFFPRPPDNAETYWLEVLSLVKELRPELSTPLTLDLQKYEEVLLEQWGTEPRVLGTVRNSPARALGLGWGDVITRVGERTVFFRDQLKAVFDASYRSGLEGVSLEWSRDGDCVQATLGPASAGSYPYGPFYPMGGLVVSDGISTAHLAYVARLVQTHQAREVLLLSSRLMEPLARNLLRAWQLLPPGTKVTVVPVPNSFFGGNVFVGDLLVVADYVRLLRSWVARNGGPDLVLIPSSPFTDWGRDLVGQSHLEISRATGLPVELIPVSRMTF